MTEVYRHLAEWRSLASASSEGTLEALSVPEFPPEVITLLEKYHRPERGTEEAPLYPEFLFPTSPLLPAFVGSETPLEVPSISPQDEKLMSLIEESSKAHQEQMEKSGSGKIKPLILIDEPVTSATNSPKAVLRLITPLTLAPEKYDSETGLNRSHDEGHPLTPSGVSKKISGHKKSLSHAQESLHAVAASPPKNEASLSARGSDIMDKLVRAVARIFLLNSYSLW